jgi:DNA repair exonuclease SbcCD ATPase subunit
VRLRALRIADLRRFGGSGAAIEGIGDGLNVFAEPNETGKSTLFDALHALLFVKHGSKRADVAALRPYEGGAPAVSADLEIDGRLYRVEKRFLSRPLARVADLAAGREIARAEAVQDWIEGALGTGAADGPAGLLWVRQGAADDVESGRAAREAALAGVVEEELGVMTGGRRMQRFRRRAADRLAALVTDTGRPRKDGPLHAARERAEAARAEDERLSAELATLREDLDARARARREKAALEDPARLSGEAAALEGAQAALRSAEEHAARLAAAEQALRLAAARQAQAAQALERLDADLRALAAARESLAAEEAALPGDAARRDAALAEERAAREGERAAEAALERADAALARARAAEAARSAAEEAGRLAGLLADARAAERAARDARAAAEAIRVDGRVLEELDRLAAEREEARHAARAALTTLRVAHAPGAEGRVRIAGEPLAEGEERRIDGPVEIEIAGVGRLSVVPGDGRGAEAARARLAEAERALAGRLGELGVADPAEARRRARERAERLAEEAGHRRTLDALAPEGLDALAREHAARTAEADRRRTAEDEAAPLAPDEAETARAAAADALARARAARETAAETRARAETALATRTSRLEQAREAAARAADALGEGDPAARRAELAEALTEADAVLAAARRERDRLAAEAPDLTLARAEARRRAEARENRREALSRLERDLARLDGRLGRAAEEGIEARAAEARGAREAAERALARQEDERAALERLLAALDAAGAGARARYFEPLDRELRPLLGLLYGGAELRFDAERLAPETLVREGRAEDIGALSGGTREQVAILARLAFARLLARGGEAPPVILDDALVFSDDDRIERMFTVLQHQAEDLQIIAFTCRQRAFASLGGRMLRLEPWAGLKE